MSQMEEDDDMMDPEDELLEAALEKDVAKVKKLLDANVSPNCKLSYNKFTPLHFAVHHPSNPELVQLLLGAGADVDPLDKYLRAPLHDTKEPECAEILLKAGAKVDRLTQASETVLHCVANFSESRDCPPPDEMSSEEEDDNEDKKKKSPDTINTESLNKLSIVQDNIVGPEVEQDAMQNEENKNMPKKYYIPPWDCESKQVECAKVLIEAGEKVGLDINAKDSGNMTALHIAALGGGSCMMKLFLRRGAEVNGGASTAGDTPLHQAAVCGYVACAEVLLNAGVAVNHADVRGDTALHWAAQRGHRRYTRALLRHGADRTAKNNRGEIATDIAKQQGNQKLVKILTSL